MAYRSAVFNPSERSLAMRRTLRDAITNWVNSTPLMSVYTPVTHEHIEHSPRMPRLEFCSKGGCVANWLGYP